MENTIDVISKQFSIAAIAKYTLMLIIGVALIVAGSMYASEPKTALYFLIVTTGAGFIITALVKMISAARISVYTPSNSPVRERSLFIKCDRVDNLIESLKNGDSNVIDKIACQSDSGLRMDVMLSDDNNFVACQLFRYVPYSYEPASEMIIHSEELSQRMVEKLRKYLN